MAKRKRKPSAPPVMVDLGPDTEAQQAGARYNDVREFRGYQVHGKRCYHSLEVMHERGQLTERQKRAGLRLSVLYWLQFKSAERNGVYVDFTPDPTAAAVHKAQKSFDFAGLSEHIPHGCREVVMHVCCGAQYGRFISGKNGMTSDGHTASMLSAQLKVALDILANELGY